MSSHFGEAGPGLAAALGNASRILPTITTAHLPSAANNSYWPEVYLNQSLVDAEHPGPYTDTPTPKVFGAVSPLDPQLFARIDDFADELLKGERSGKYSPIEVAQWIEDYAAEARGSLAGRRRWHRGRSVRSTGGWRSISRCRRRWGGFSARSSAAACFIGFTSGRGVGRRWRLFGAVPGGAGDLGGAGESGEGCVHSGYYGRGIAAVARALAGAAAGYR